MYGGDGATAVHATAAETRNQPATSVPGAPSTSASVNSSSTAVGATQEKSLEERIDGVFATISVSPMVHHLTEQLIDAILASS